MLQMSLDSYEAKLYRGVLFFIASFFFWAPRP